MDPITALLLICAGGVGAMIIDVLWWNINYKKVEKGLEVLEHYHMGIILMIGAVLINLVYQPVSLFLIGMGFVFIVAEWHQSVEKSGKKIIPGKPFAYGSKHFKQSSAIGAGLGVFLLILTLVL
ncbi:MAG: hypothetical protein ACR2P9_08660 [Gammaproteobacteria bacterium]